MLNRIDSFFIRVVTASKFFAIDFAREFPRGVQIHATNSLSSISGFGPNPQQFFATANIVNFQEHLPGGGVGPVVWVPSLRQNAISVPNCAKFTFRSTAANADAQS